MAVIVSKEKAALKNYLAAGLSPIVVMPVYGGDKTFSEAVLALSRNTPDHVDVLIIDDASKERITLENIYRSKYQISQHLYSYQKTINEGYVAACNDAFDITGQRDIILLNSDCVVGPEWYVRLCDAAESSPQVATVSTLTNHGTVLSVPYRNAPVKFLPNELSPDQAAIQVSKSSGYLRPDLPTAVGHCLYIKRTALNLVGGFDPVFGRGYGEEVDFSLRCSRMGLRNICADDVFTFHYGSGSFGDAAKKLQSDNHRIVVSRYPYYERTVQAASTQERGELAAAIETASASLLGKRIGIDARKLGPRGAGTETLVFGTLKALSATNQAQRIQVFIRKSEEERISNLLGRTENLIFTFVDDQPFQQKQVDVIYRPCQVDNWEDLAWLHSVGRRVIINQLDVISFSNPEYSADFESWQGYRDLTRMALSAADGVTTISSFSQSEIERLQLVPENGRLKMIYNGSSTEFADLSENDRKPDGIGFEDCPFLLMLGTDYHHKNRIFSLRLFQQLRVEGWEGFLVFAGATPPYGNSRSEVVEVLLSDPLIRNRVVDLGVISEFEKRWLYRNAALCLYPSVTEGFGLVPFESAAHDSPVMFSNGGSLGEVLPNLANFSNFDIKKAVITATQLLKCQHDRESQRLAINDCSSRFDWSEHGRQLDKFFDEIIAKPRNRCAAVHGESAHAVSSVSVSLLISSRMLAFGKTLRFLARHPRLKRILSPDGSIRQKIFRRIIHQLRTKRHRRRTSLEILRA